MKKKTALRKIVLCALSFTTLFSYVLPLNAGALSTNANTKAGGISWVDAVKQAQALFKDGGGYYTGRATSPNTWEGMDAAYQLGAGDAEPTIDVSKARPSFCSSATYMLFVKSLQIWNESRNILSKDAWVNLKPYTMDGTVVNGKTIPVQSDGYGLWGRCNANGPGLAVMAQELKVCKNYYVGNRSEYADPADYYKAWDQAKPYDFMKIFWNSGIGCDDKNPDGDEAGHMVLFLRKELAYDTNGNRDDMIYWWSSNGSKKDLTDASGYGVRSCHESKIYRAVLTEITNPENFKSAANVAPDNVNAWLDSLNGKHHGTVAEMNSQCGFQPLTKNSLVLDTTCVRRIYTGCSYSFLLRKPVTGVAYTASALNGNVLKTVLTSKKCRGGWLFTITGLQAGKTDVIVEGSNNTYASFPVEVLNRSFTLDTKSYQMAPGDCYEIGANVKGVGVDSLKVASTNPGVASISLKGGCCKVTGRRAGTAYIMYDLYDGAKKAAHASVRVTVKPVTKAHGDSTRQTVLF